MAFWCILITDRTIFFLCYGYFCSFYSWSIIESTLNSTIITTCSLIKTILNFYGNLIIMTVLQEWVLPWIDIIYLEPLVIPLRPWLEFLNRYFNMAYKDYLRFKCLIIFLPKYVFLLCMRSFSCNVLKLDTHFIHERNNSHGPDVVWPYELKINKKI